MAERTYEKGTKALHCRRESSHLEATPFGQGDGSDLCEELGLGPTVFYRWRKELRERGGCFSCSGASHCEAEEKQKRIEFLDKKVQTTDEVVAGLMAEHIALKNHLGNSRR
jgi:transposase